MERWAARRIPRCRSTITCVADSHPLSLANHLSAQNIAAQQNHRDACFALTAWYLVGSPGVLPQSDTEAFLWAQKAAEGGLVKAMYAVGYFLEVGIGTAANLPECVAPASPAPASVPLTRAGRSSGTNARRTWATSGRRSACAAPRPSSVRPAGPAQSSTATAAMRGPARARRTRTRTASSCEEAGDRPRYGIFGHFGAHPASVLYSAIMDFCCCIHERQRGLP